jgi:cellobiose-specific phosphotransferase system component IIC
MVGGGPIEKFRQICEKLGYFFLIVLILFPFVSSCYLAADFFHRVIQVVTVLIGLFLSMSILYPFLKVLEKWKKEDEKC